MDGPVLGLERDTSRHAKRVTEEPDEQVVDVADESRFVIHEDGLTAELDYQLEDGRLVLVHTGVPDAVARRGIGSRLVRAAVERAARDQLVLVPWCPFARWWLRSHSEVSGNVRIDWEDRPPLQA